MTRNLAARVLTTTLCVGMVGLVGAGCTQSDRSGAFTGALPPGQINPSTTPTITSISPAKGPTKGGDQVTVQGTNLPVNPAVTVSGRSATIVSSTSTQIVLVTPAGSAGAAEVTVKGSSGTFTLQGGFTYEGMTITGVSPAGGVSGDTITISGTNFFDVTSVSPLSAFTVVSPTQITGTVGSGTATVDVLILSSTMGSIRAAGGFSFPVTPPSPPPPPPSIATITPVSVSGGGGATVTITGNFPTGVTAVTLGGFALSSFSLDPSMTQITGSVGVNPPVGGPFDVVVTQTGGGVLTLSGAFSVSGVTIATISTLPPGPLVGPDTGGTTVAITGTGFQPGQTTVNFGGTAAVLVSESPTSLTMTTPVHASGLVDIMVTTTLNGSATQVGAFTFFTVGALPQVTSITPANGPESGGTQVTISGSNFISAAADVAFIASNLLNLQVLDDSTITGETSPLDQSALDAQLGPGSVAPLTTQVIVRSTANGDSVEPVFFTYTPAVFISRVSPNQGPVVGGTLVSVFGRNFQGGGSPRVTDVKFGGTSGTALSIISDTELQVVTPAGPRAGATGVELVGDGVFAGAMLGFGFTYGPVLDDPTFPFVDSRDTPGDLFGPQGRLGDAGMLGMSAASRLASADFDTGGIEVLALTLPLTSELRVLSNRVQTTPDCLTGQINGTLTLGLSPGLPPLPPVAINPPVALNGVPNDVVLTLVNADRQADAVVALADGSIDVVLTTTLIPQLLAGPVNVAGGIAAPTGIGTADFNRDGRFDIVTCGGVGAASAISIFINNGGGSFNAPVQILLSTVTGAQPNPNPVRLIAADPNGPTLLGLTPGTDQNVIDRLPRELLSDLNGDGTADIAVLNGNGDISFLFGDGTGAFPTSSTNSANLLNPVDVSSSDFNGDNNLDLVVLTQQDIAIFQGSVSSLTAMGSVAQVQTLTFPGGGTTNPNAILADDYNFDCREDVVLANFNGQDIALYLSQGNGAFDDPVLYKGTTAFNLGGASVVDVARNRRRKLWLADNNAVIGQQAVVELEQEVLTIFRGEPVASLTPPTPTSGITPRGIGFADMDRDGDNDLVICNFGNSSIEVRRNGGAGSFGSPTLAPTGTGPRNLALGDFNADGFTDVVVCNDHGATMPVDTITFHANTTSNGTIAVVGTSISIGAKGPREIALGDVNNDGNLDLVTVNQTTNNVSVLLATPAMTTPFMLNGVFGVGNAPLAIVLADMGQPESPAAPSTRILPDGNLDVVVCNSADDTVTILYGDGAGNFGSGETYPLGGDIQPDRLAFNMGFLPSSMGLPRVGVEPVDLVVTDINGDGGLDILTADKGTNTVTILHANVADRLFASVVPGNPDIFAFDPDTANAPVQFLAAEEVNQPILPAANMPGLGFVIAPANVRKYFLPTDYRYDVTLDAIGQPRVTLPTGNGPAFILAADFDVDGKQDVLTGNFDSGSLTVYINTGTNHQGSGAEGPPPPLPSVLDPPPDPPFFMEVIPGPQVGEFTTLGEAIFRSPQAPLLPVCPGYSNVSSVPTAFTISIGTGITGCAVARINGDCPPDVGILRVDNMFEVRGTQ
ncbi:IPT/TIG domain-containing protein [Planctomycetota bacterium]|nr:IPT/TIG domain-containing protein [Planctomycetota bacterium]